MISSGKARSGDLILYVNERSIHSKYDPVNEADNFIRSQSITKKINKFILLGPGIGYLNLSLTKMFSHAEILSIHMDNEIYKNSLKIGKSWTYKDKASLKKILEDFIPDFLLSNTSIIKWLPCTACFPDRISEIEKTIQQFFLERKGSLYTTAGFGLKWFSNIFNNFIFKKKFYEISNISSPIFIAASGPSLIESFTFLKNYRNNIILAALPSSLMALKSESIKPDIVINTDPGFWAKEHLKHLPDTKVPIVMPLTSVFVPELVNPIILFNQGTETEKYLLSNNSVYINSHGTVAGSAYLFFRQISNNPIIFLGLDFVFSDVLEHVTPHSFDVFYTNKQNRLNGYLDILYKKKQQQQNNNSSLKNKTSNAFSTYSGWFNSDFKLFNTYRFKPSNIETKSLKDINLQEIIKIIANTKKNDIILKKSVKQDIGESSKTYDLFLQHVLNLLEKYHQDIDTINFKEIINLFSKQSLLLEIFQFSSYIDILKISNFYNINLYKTKEILEIIYMKSKIFIKQFQKRLNCE